MRLQRMAIVTTALFMLVGAHAACFAGPDFYSTSDPNGHWYVSTKHPGADGQLSSFDTGNFQQAVLRSGSSEVIANIPSGSNGSGVGDWTFFVFRQTFDLTGYDPKSAELKFQWAADDSGEGFADRGTWIPKFALNGGEFIYYPGASSGHPVNTYSYSSIVDLTSGFVPGVNTIDFYVEGNGITDGFALKTAGFTANTAPEPASMLLFGLGGGVLGFIRRKRSQRH